MVSEKESGPEGAKKYTSCLPLTSDAETDLLLDVALRIPDGVAASVRPGDGAEGDVAIVHADPPLVAFPGHPCEGHQHQTRPGGGKGPREDRLCFTFPLTG